MAVRLAGVRWLGRASGCVPRATAVRGMSFDSKGRAEEARYIKSQERRTLRESRIAPEASTTQTRLLEILDRAGLVDPTGAGGAGSPRDKRLFDELMAGVEAATYNLITDPENTGTPPDGVDVLVTEGAVRRTLFVQPVLRGTPLPFLDLQLGLLLAWSSGPVTQGFYTARNGGVATNHHNDPSDGRFLGAETDLSITARIPFKGSIKETPAPGTPMFETQLQIGTLMTGAALRSLEGDSGRLGKLMLTGRLRW